VLVQPDGKILMAGSARQDQIRFAPIQGALARFNANGTSDSSFGTGGRMLLAAAGSPNWPGRSRSGVLLQQHPRPGIAQPGTARVRADVAGRGAPRGDG
jgi:hypothetical protein